MNRRKVIFFITIDIYIAKIIKSEWNDFSIEMSSH